MKLMETQIGQLVSALYSKYYCAKPRGILSMFEEEGFWNSYERSQFLKTAFLRALCIRNRYTSRNKKSANRLSVANNCLQKACQSGDPRNFAKQSVNTAERLQFMSRNITLGKFVTSVIRLLNES